MFHIRSRFQVNTQAQIDNDRKQIPRTKFSSTKINFLTPWTYLADDNIVKFRKTGNLIWLIQCHIGIKPSSGCKFNEIWKSDGLEKKYAMNRARWRLGIREIAAGVNPATPIYGDKPGSKLDWLIDRNCSLEYHFIVLYALGKENVAKDVHDA